MSQQTQSLKHGLTWTQTHTYRPKHSISDTNGPTKTQTHSHPHTDRQSISNLPWWHTHSSKFGTPLKRKDGLDALVNLYCHLLIIFNNKFETIENPYIIEIPYRKKFWRMKVPEIWLAAKYFFPPKNFVHRNFVQYQVKKNISRKILKLKIIYACILGREICITIWQIS